MLQKFKLGFHKCVFFFFFRLKIKFLLVRLYLFDNFSVKINQFSGFSRYSQASEHEGSEKLC